MSESRSPISVAVVWLYGSGTVLTSGRVFPGVVYCHNSGDPGWKNPARKVLSNPRPSIKISETISGPRDDDMRSINQSAGSFPERVIISVIQRSASSSSGSAEGGEKGGARGGLLVGAA